MSIEDPAPARPEDRVFRWGGLIVTWTHLVLGLANLVLGVVVVTAERGFGSAAAILFLVAGLNIHHYRRRRARACHQQR